MSILLPEKWIKTKVTFGFSILVTIAIVIISISYYSVVSIIKVQNESVDNNVEFTVLNQLVFGIIETEGISRVYGVTGEEKYAEEYALHHDSVLNILEFLPVVFNDTSSINSIEKVKKLYLQKKQYMDELQDINLIKLRFSGADNILSSLPDSLYYNVTEYTYTKVRLDTLENQELNKTEDKPQKRRGLFKAMGDFLSGKKKRDEERLKNEPVVSKKTDSILTKQIRSDENIQHIKSELRKVSSREKRLNKSLQKHENDLIKLDRLITEEIEQIINHLQLLSIEKNRIRRENLQLLRNDMMNSVLLLVVSAVLLMLFFIIWISRDVTKSKKLKNEIIKAKERVDKLLKVKEHFVAHMSHEIRTPLTSIIGFSEQLNEHNLKTNEKSLATKIRISAEHLKGLINNILDFSMLEAGGIEFYKDHIRIENMMSEIYHLFELNAQQKNIRLNYEFDEDLKVFVSDHIRLKQVLINLVGNALKFTHDGSVMYDVNINKEKLVFTVKDTGIGIPKDKQNTIFKMFNQVNISLSRKYSGTGLGLSICRQIIEAMGGSISVSSTVGKGSVFTFEIPYVKGEVNNVKHSNTKEYDFSNYNILAIDDDEMICQLIDGILSKKLNRLDVNTSSELALKAMDHVKYDLFMIDLHMPEKDGLQIKEMIRTKKGINTPILFLTADIINSELQKAVKEEDGIWFLNKPFSQDVLFNKLDGIFNGITQKSEFKTEIIEHKKTSYDLSGVKSFTGNDEEFLSSVIHAFINNSDEGIEAMKMLVENENYSSEIKEKAHKMLTGFRQFQISDGIVILDILENNKAKDINKEQIKEYLDQLEKLWQQIKPELQTFAKK